MASSSAMKIDDVSLRQESVFFPTLLLYLDPSVIAVDNSVEVFPINEELYVNDFRNRNSSGTKEGRVRSRKGQ